MTDVLEFSDITAEIKGALCPGRLKLTDQHIIFKNSKTGKVEQISSSDLELSNWQKLVGNWGLRIFLKNGTLHRFCGFKEQELEKVAKYFKDNYSNELLEKDLSLKGWNWGTAKFNGSVLSFDINNLAAFEIPLAYVSQCTTGKNEVAVEFHQNDEAPVSLMEMRFHIPMSELAGDDPVEAFHSRIMEKASVISNPGDAIAIFREIHCLTPRGRYDIKIFQSFFQLHGKTFDYKIPKETIIRLFVLPHKDGRQNFLVVSLDPPIKQGQTRYHYLVFLFGQDDDTSVELPFSEEELKEKYEGKLTKELSGPTYDVISRIMKALVNRKITVPGNFRGHSGTPAVGCSYKAAAGYLYPLERGFIYIHKPPLHIRFEEIQSVNFARSGGSTRSFDCEIELKSGVIHTFSSIEKEEYGKLFDFITSKKLRVKNTKSDKPDYSGGIGEDFGDSDEEGEPDAYLARVKREGKEREEDVGGGDSDDESEDEDFDPVAYEAQKKKESQSSSGEEDDSGSGAGVSDEEKDKKKKKEKKEKKPKTVSEKPRKTRKKKEKDENRPKRAPSAYMLWFNENREEIKGEAGAGAGITDIAKKAGEIWKTMQDKSEWEGKAAKLKEEYQAAMAEYKASGGGAKEKSSDSAPAKEKSSSKKAPIAVSPTKAGAGSGFISKEFIEDSESSSDEDKKKKGGKKTKEAKESDDSDKETKPKKKNEKKKAEESDEAESDKDDSEDEDYAKSSDKEGKSSDKDEKSSDKEQKSKKKGGDSESEEILSTPTASSASESD